MRLCVKMRLRPGLCPEPRWGAYSAPPEPLAAFEEGGERRGGKDKGSNPQTKILATALDIWVFKLCFSEAFDVLWDRY